MENGVQYVVFTGDTSGIVSQVGGTGISSFTDPDSGDDWNMSEATFTGIEVFHIM